MTTASLDTSRIVRLRDLVDSIADRSGCWVVIESFGQVVCHGTGADAPPRALVEALVSKCTSSLRTAVEWHRDRPDLTGEVEGQSLAANDLGEGGTAWFVGGRPDRSVASALSAALQSEGTPLVDPFVHDLLHPRGIARNGAAPPARLVALRSQHPINALALAAWRAVSDAAARVHVEQDTVVVALPVHTQPEPMLTSIRRRCPGASAGVALTPEDAADWSTTYELAGRALDVARATGRDLGDPADPEVAAELLVRHAEDAAAALARQLPQNGLQRLEQHDRAQGSDLLLTLTAWCRSGFDVGQAAGALHVHVNTLRYRLRRVSEISGMDLSRPLERQAVQLLLRH